MWSEILSFDKAYTKEAAYIFASLSELKWASVAEESGNSRIRFIAAAPDSLKARLKGELEGLFCKYYLSTVKLGYLMERINLAELNHTYVALLASMLTFDAEAEQAQIVRALREIDDFNFDAVINFRLKELKENWDELSELSNNLLAASEGDDDLFYACGFLAGASREGHSKLIIYKINNDVILKNLISGKRLEILPLYDEKEYNLLTAIIAARPSKINVEGVNFSDGMSFVLKHFGYVTKG